MELWQPFCNHEGPSITLRGQSLNMERTWVCDNIAESLHNSGTTLPLGFQLGEKRNTLGFSATGSWAFSDAVASIPADTLKRQDYLGQMD